MKKQYGFGLLETLGALAVTSIMMVSFARMTSDSSTQLKGTATAQNFKQVYDAGSRYIKDNYGVLLTSTPATITTRMLVSTGYLPATYSGLNPYAQSTTIQVTQPVVNTLQAIVMTSAGNAIPEASAPVISSKVGSAGAYFPVATPNTAKGAFGGWSLDMTGSSPGAGHLAGLIFYNNGDLVSDYLQRHQIPGHPEVNEMFTAINMNNNDINNANNVNTVDVNATNVNAINNVNTGNVNASNNVTVGNAISASTVSVSNNQATTNNNSSGTFQITSVSTAGDACSPNGLMSMDANSKILTCQNGVWGASGSFGGTFTNYAQWDKGCFGNYWYTTGSVNPYTGSRSCPAGFNAYQMNLSICQALFICLAI